MGIDDLLPAILAGLLTALNPCVLPMLPIVFAAALSQHRAGPIALAIGVSISFVAISLFIWGIGFSIGLDSKRFRLAGAVLMVMFGVILLVPQLQARLATAAGPVANWAQRRFAGVEGTGWRGQLGLGLVLGIVWSPCTGPTLGAASELARQGESLPAVAAVLLVFGVSAAIPLIALGLLSRAALMRWRDRLLLIGWVGKLVLGGLLVTIGVLILTGLDLRLEAYFNRVLPVWLSNLTVRF